VSPVNDAPVAADDTAAVTEDTAATGNVLTNDTDVDGPALSVTQFTVSGDATVYTAGSTATIAGVGTLQIDADGSFTFTPASNYTGAVPVATYTVTDGSLTDTATLTLGPVSPVNDAPVATDDTLAVTEDTAATGNVLTNDTDVDGPALSVTEFTVAGDATVYTAGSTATIAGVGTLLVNADGSFTFTPATSYTGAVPVATYTVTDGSLTDTATLTLGPVSPVNDAPVATDDTLAVTEDTAATGNVLTNDTDVDGPALSVTQFTVAGDATVYTAGSTATIAGVGTLQIDADGSFTFTPATSYTGAVPVATYTVTDGSLTDTATLTLGPVSPVNDAPVATDDTLAVTEDTAATGNVLSNDTDVDGPALSVTQFTVAGDATVYTAGSTATIAGVGTLLVDADGSFTFTPATSYTGAVPVATYTVTDGSLTDTATLTLGPVSPVNDAPVATDDTLAVTEDTAATGNVLSNDTDVDGPALSVTQFTVAGDATVYTAGSTAMIAGVGTLLVNADGSFTFTPASNYTGAVPVATYTVTDGSLTDTATLTLGPVSPVNDAPVATDDTLAVTEDTAATGNVLTNDAAVDGPALSVTQFSVAGFATVRTADITAMIAGVGTLLVNADGSFTFTPASNYTGAVPVAT